MKKLIAMSAAVLAALTVSASAPAHHSLVLFDAERPIWLKGSFVRIDRINPHSRIVIDQTLPNGDVERWTVDGPDVRRLDRMGIGEDFFAVGDQLEFCGFAMREEIIREREREGTNRLPNLFINGNLLVMPNGDKWRWADYGQLPLCLSEDELDSVRR